MGLSSHNGDKDFIWCLNLPRAYISSPLDALRTFLACARTTARRSLTCLYVAPGSYIFSLPETRRTFSLSRLHSLNGEEVF